MPLDIYRQRRARALPKVGRARRGVTAPADPNHHRPSRGREMAEAKIIPDDVLRLVKYNPDGVLTWLPRQDGSLFPSTLVGLPAGAIQSKGYVKFRSGGRGYFCHRVVWHMFHGPTVLQVDHINGVRHDNRIENLRLADYYQNSRNTKPRADGVSRFKGVSPAPKGKWQARIRVDGRKTQIGTFACEIEAAMAYDEAARRVHGQFCRTNEGMGLY